MTIPDGQKQVFSEIQDLKRAVILLAESSTGVSWQDHEKIIVMLGDVPEVKRIPKKGEKWKYGSSSFVITLINDGEMSGVWKDGSTANDVGIDELDEFICTVDLSFLGGEE